MGKTSPGHEKTTSQTSVFISMALDMTWRLAVVVLVPIIGGFYLDQWLNMTPVFTITGFFLAMAGIAVVFWQTLQTANTVEIPKGSDTKAAKKPKKDTK
jgi:F0F1-type ATP synthase assembly protein I